MNMEQTSGKMSFYKYEQENERMSMYELHESCLEHQP